MSAVCYCGGPKCPVVTWDESACADVVIRDLRAQRDALAEALRNTLRAAEGFMASVRADTKTAYPWEPWEYESEKARAALAKVTP